MFVFKTRRRTHRLPSPRQVIVLSNPLRIAHPSMIIDKPSAIPLFSERSLPVTGHPILASCSVY